MRPPRDGVTCLCIATTHQPSGKTSVTLGLAVALAARGAQVQTFKECPDFIDPIEAGLPTWAQGGGMKDLTSSLVWHGQSYPMVGAIPADAVMHERPQGPGLVALKETTRASGRTLPVARRSRRTHSPTWRWKISHRRSALPITSSVALASMARARDRHRQHACQFLSFARYLAASRGGTFCGFHPANAPTIATRRDSARHA